jgi:hypothetical protein
MTGLTCICKNKDCTAYRKELWLNPTWPLGLIDSVINSPLVQEHPDFKEQLIKRKAAGAKYALIQMPNKGVVEVVGYRFTLYCSDCCTVWEREVVEPQAKDGSEPQDGRSATDLLDRHCDKCNRQLPTTKDLMKEDAVVPCPICEEPLEKRAWYVQDEKESSEKESETT